MRVKSEMDDDEKGKLFVGGLSWETTQDNLQRYFSRYGEVIDCVVMKNSESGRSRGFGFVTFSDPSNVGLVLQNGPHQLDGRTIDPKPCNPRTLQKPKRSGGFPKVFLGGLPSNVTETDLRSFFQRFGKVMEVVIMYDQEKKKSRGFGFLSFEDEDAVDRCVAEHFVNLNGKQVEIKRAEPRDSSNKMNDGHQGQWGPPQQGPPMGMAGNMGPMGGPNGQMGGPMMGGPMGPPGNMMQQYQGWGTSPPTTGYAGYNAQYSTQGWGAPPGPPQQQQIPPPPPHQWGSSYNVQPAAANQAYGSYGGPAAASQGYGHATGTGGAAGGGPGASWNTWNMPQNGPPPGHSSQPPPQPPNSSQLTSNSNLSGPLVGADSVSDCNKEELELCIEYAKRCVHEEKLDEAKRYLEKAQQLCPKIVIEDLLDQMKSEENTQNIQHDIHGFDKNSATDMDCNRKEAERCIKFAECCIRVNRVDNAKECLEEAQRLYPKIVTKDLLEKFTFTSIPNDNHVHASETSVQDNANASTNHDEQEAKRYLKLAEDCLRANKLGDAEKYLAQSQSLQKTPKSIRLSKRLIHLSKKFNQDEYIDEAKKNSVDIDTAFPNTSHENIEPRNPAKGDAVIPSSQNENSENKPKKSAKNSTASSNTWNGNVEDKPENCASDHTSSSSVHNGNVEGKENVFAEADTATPDVECNKNEAEQCIKLAEDCIREKKFGKAKRHLKKAQRLYPSEKIENLLEKVGTMSADDTNTKTSDTKTNGPNGIDPVTPKDQAEQYLKLAENCIQRERFDDARKHLEKAQGLHPTNKTEKLLKKVLSMSAESTNRSTSESDAKKPSGGVGGVSNKDQAKQRQEQAERCMREGKHDDAKKYLEEAQNLHPNKKTKMLLKKLTDTIASTNCDTPEPDVRNPYDGVAGDANKEQADKCRELAEGCIREEKYDDAIKYLEKAQKLHPTKKTRKLLAKVLTMSANSANQNSTETDAKKRCGGNDEAANRKQSDRCRELAGRCIREENFGEAKKHLEEAQRLHPTKKTQQLLDKIASMPVAASKSCKTEPEEPKPSVPIGRTARQEQAEECRENAERCIKEKNYAEAEKYLRRSYRLWRSEKTVLLLNRVIRLTEQRMEAQKCLDHAERCMNWGNLSDAKEYFQKAQNLYPTEATAERLRKVTLMTSKRDQAERCKESARRLVREKKYDEALKLLKEAHSLHPTTEIADMMRRLSSFLNRRANKPKVDTENVPLDTPYDPATATYTQEQWTVVTRVLKSKDNYEILGVSRQASIDEYRQAYKKLALQLHPDKNKAPGATEAFRAVKHAVNVLTGETTEAENEEEEFDFEPEFNLSDFRFQFKSRNTGFFFFTTRDDNCTVQ